MKKLTSIYKQIATAVVLLLLFTACKKDFYDPSGPSSDQAFSSPIAITDVAVGLQNWYTAARGGLVYNTVTADGLLTGQLYVVNAGNTDEAQLGTGGGSLLNTNGVVTGIWSVSNKIIYDANKIIAKAPGVISDKKYLATLIGYTSIFKALAMSDMAMYWQNAPDGVADTFNVSKVKFIPNTQAFTNAIAVIDNAISGMTTNGATGTEIAKYVPGGIDIMNTLNALKARFAVLSGNYPLALTTANLVNLSVKSYFNYNAVTTNPIFTLATATNNIYQPVDLAMGLPAGLQPDPADKRIPFYIATSANPTYRINGFFNSVTAIVPVYLPGEMMLIKSECYARANDVVNGKAWLDSVVTKTAAKDPFGVGAALPPSTVVTPADILDQVYRNRAIELYMSGLRLVDSRRFNRPQAERKRNYFPYPFVERNDNPNTPADPPL
ncbi:MAG: RagB/SusD family nutrient uptake outer membrane protein [Filimonas sp.]|nr:RagB/SusD family nutrient uptake outer membrane protein [Filimonas sp.]